MKKSIISLVLAVFMMMGLCISSSASEFTPPAGSTEPDCGRIWETRVTFTQEDLAALAKEELAGNEKAATPEPGAQWSEPACGKVSETQATLPEEDLPPSPIAAHGTSTPSSFWNIGHKGTYAGSFSSLETAALYTVHYFDWYPTVKDGSDSGILYVNYEVYPQDQSTAEGSLKITAFCRDCEEELASCTTGYDSAKGPADGPVSGTAWFTSGSAHMGHFVYFRLENNEDESGVRFSLNGNFRINYENDR